MGRELARANPGGRAEKSQEEPGNPRAMPSPEFNSAALVTVDEDEEAFMVGFAEREDGQGAFLILQASVTPPSQSDLANGFDTYCSVDESDAVCYGGLRRAELQPGRVLLQYEAEASEVLGLAAVGGRLALTLPPGTDQARLAGALRRVLIQGDEAKRPEAVGF
jgi:hypothetical protein